MGKNVFDRLDMAKRALNRILLICTCRPDGDFHKADCAHSIAEEALDQIKLSE
jgi:hypothetical protein